MERQIFVASCPVCGRVLFKGSENSHMEGGCPKCKSYLEIKFNFNGYQVSVKNIENK